MHYDLTNTLWEFKYAPATIEDMILPLKYKDLFSGWIKNGDFNNCLLCSNNPGSGKTSVANIVRNSNQFVSMFINASRETSIDVVRNNIKNFVSTVSIDDKPKIVILDEADRMSPNSLDALKAEIEIRVDNARFIFTANRESVFPDPIISRLKVFNFDRIFVENKIDLFQMAFKRMKFILESEKVKFSSKAVASVIKKYAPDWRNVIKSCQLMSVYSNKITEEEVLSLDVKNDVEKLIGLLKEKNFSDLREFSVKHIGNEIQILEELYNAAKSSEVIKNTSKPNMILILADMNRHISLVPDPEIELFSTLLKLTAEIEFE